MRIGVLGATGAVGSTVLEVLSERRFPVTELIPFASERSVGRRLPWTRPDGTVEELECRAPVAGEIAGLDIVISSAGGSVSAEWAPRFVEKGAVVIDNTSYWRMHAEVPLVIPEVNPEAVDSHSGIIANPNCSTVQMVLALAPIHRAAVLRRVVVSTYQSVSGTGQNAIEELRSQSHSILAGEAFARPSVYPHPIAFNALPQVETFAEGDDYTTEERKMMAETRKILGLSEEDLAISATCVRVPVFNGHSESINVETERDLTPERCRQVLAEWPGVLVLDDPAESLYPLSSEAAGRDEVLVGRIRRDPGRDRCLNLWVVGDNLRKGAATNTVQVAELLVQRGVV